MCAWKLKGKKHRTENRFKWNLNQQQADKYTDHFWRSNPKTNNQTNDLPES